MLLFLWKILLCRLFALSCIPCCVHTYIAPFVVIINTKYSQHHYFCFLFQLERGVSLNSSYVLIKSTLLESDLRRNLCVSLHFVAFMFLFLVARLIVRMRKCRANFSRVFYINAFIAWSLTSSRNIQWLSFVAQVFDNFFVISLYSCSRVCATPFSASFVLIGNTRK